MTIKLLLILCGAAAFGWGFSELVEHSGSSIRPYTQPHACQEWSGAGCDRPVER